MQIQTNITEKHHDEVVKLIRAKQVRERLGGISGPTLYRMWKLYGVLAPPIVIRGMLYWNVTDVNLAIKNSQRGEVRTDPTPTQAIATPTKTTPTERATIARHARLSQLADSQQVVCQADTPPARRPGRPRKVVAATGDK